MSLFKEIILTALPLAAVIGGASLVFGFFRFWQVFIKKEDN